MKKTLCIYLAMISFFISPIFTQVSSWGPNSSGFVIDDSVMSQAGIALGNALNKKVGQIKFSCQNRNPATVAALLLAGGKGSRERQSRFLFI